MDVLHYDLDLNFGLADSSISGTVTITLEWGSDPDNLLTLNFVNMAVTEVRDGGGGVLPFVHARDLARSPMSLLQFGNISFIPSIHQRIARQVNNRHAPLS